MLQSIWINCSKNVCTKWVTYAIDWSLGKFVLILIISKKVTKMGFKMIWSFIVFESLKKYFRKYNLLSKSPKLLTVKCVSTMFKGQCNINLLEYIIWNFHFATLNHHLKKSVKFVPNMESICTKVIFSECVIFVSIIRALVKAEAARVLAVPECKRSEKKNNNCK